MNFFCRTIVTSFPSSKHGFTLTELMISVALLMMIVSITALQLNFFSSALVRSELDALQTICMHLQSCAQASNAPHTLQFNKAQRSYTYNGYTAYLPRGVNFGVLPGVQGPPAACTGTITDPITFKNDCITFYPHGIIQAGAVYLVDASNHTLYALTCAVAHVSYVRKYRYDQGWKLLQ